MKQIVTAVAIILMFSVKAQTFDSNKMDAFLDVIASNDKGMGSISIFKNGKEIYQKAYGLSHLTINKKNDATTKFRIGSVSKTFTATIIMQMVDEKKLALNTTLSSFFPSIPNAKLITIENLLQHRSGLLSFTRIENFNDWRDNALTRKELLEKIENQDIVFKPNEKTEYSNTNYILLSMIAEKIERLDFKNIVENRIITACNLSETSFGSTLDINNNEALSYNYDSNGWVADKETHYSIPLGAGSIASTPTDLNIFYYHLFEKNLVSKQSLETMKTIVDEFGIGMYIIPFYEHISYGHEGSIDAFQSVAVHFPKEKITIALVSNGNIYPINNILINALGLCFDKEFSIPEFVKSIQLKSEDLDVYLGNYSGPQFPLKVTITKNDNQLIVKAEGQPEFTVEAYEPHKFIFEQAEIYFTFILEEKKMIVNQGGKDYNLFLEQ